MQGLKAELLRGCWYVALPGSALARGRMTVRTMLGEPVLIARRNDGSVFAIGDICPHRAMPLHHGTFDGERVHCSYHGWQYDGDGTCRHIPSMMPDQKVDMAKIRCGTYPCVERQGLVWVYFARDREAPSGDVAKPPLIPLVGENDAPKDHVELLFPCSIDHTAYGLMDPGHVAFVHTSKWYRRKANVVKPKEKSFEPCDLGFRMLRHKASAQNFLYRVLGRNVSTEISYKLPGFRIEDIHGDRHAVVMVSALTPLNDEETVFNQFLWATPGWVRPLRPIIHHFIKAFLEQDRDVAIKQREGLLLEPKLMLVNDANTQARWWMRLKDEWMAAGREGRPFVNPLKPMTLRWMS